MRLPLAPVPAPPRRKGAKGVRKILSPSILRNPLKSPNSTTPEPEHRDPQLRVEAGAAGIHDLLRRTNPDPMKTATITYTDDRTLPTNPCEVSACPIFGSDWYGRIGRFRAGKWPIRIQCRCAEYGHDRPGGAGREAGSASNIDGPLMFQRDTR